MTEGSGSTRRGHKDRDTSAVRATGAAAAIAARAASCAGPEGSWLIVATCASARVSAKNPRPAGISAGTARAGTPTSEKSLRSASRSTSLFSTDDASRPTRPARSAVTTTWIPTEAPSRSSLIAVSTTAPESTSSKLERNDSQPSTSTTTWGNGIGDAARCSLSEPNPSAAKVLCLAYQLRFQDRN